MRFQRGFDRIDQHRLTQAPHDGRRLFRVLGARDVAAQVGFESKF